MVPLENYNNFAIATKVEKLRFLQLLLLAKSTLNKAMGKNFPLYLFYCSHLVWGLSNLYIHIYKSQATETAE